MLINIEKFDKQIKEYLKNNLTINIMKYDGCYGTRDYIEVEVKLNDEIISTSTTDL